MSSIYKDPSIGNLINIVIVKLVIINNEPVRLLYLCSSPFLHIYLSFIREMFNCLSLCVSQDGPVISFNAQATLKNFCIWQQSQNILDDNHHSHHDTAILITRCLGFIAVHCVYFGHIFGLNTP